MTESALEVFEETLPQEELVLSFEKKSILSDFSPS